MLQSESLARADSCCGTCPTRYVTITVYVTVTTADTAVLRREGSASILFTPRKLQIVRIYFTAQISHYTGGWPPLPTTSMFSLRPPRKVAPALPGSTMPLSSSSAHHIYQSDASGDRSNNGTLGLGSERSSHWSFSASTLVDGTTSAPSRRHRHSTPVHRAFVCEIPEDPLRAAAEFQPVLEHSPSLDGAEDTSAHSLLDFSRCKVGSLRPRRSALSAMVTSPNVRNPFAGVASSVTGGSLCIKVYFPRAQQPAGQLLHLALSPSATVEDVIALALWTYWEQHWLPKLNPSSTKDIDVASWILLVPGKDGVVNKRIAQSKIRNFKFDKYAVVRSPRNLAEKQRIEKQVSRFTLLSPHGSIEQTPQPSV
ncbi:hypothetical protein DFH06DRAFT_645537 [Mycena polygramma]|nr:hypothetical protein DFH06DRAFT_645537 [Mycena polygramma]